ncbi:MAG: nucleotidyl transferase AbiEii/AbiGii toxin family protein [Acidobacteriia bacterium]|nr:nucleotidyl transferase AbiEii/AbiGii toxin family protein [Terriglobia bacterium]
MTNTSNPPLEIRHDQIDPLILEAIRKLDEIAHRHETPYFLAGATAREIMLRHVFGRPPGRRTLDVDLGIAVRDWDHFKLLQTALVEQRGFQPHARLVQRITYPSNPPVVVDLIPFGGVETAERTIAWPPEEDIVMRVTGFSDGLESAVPVRLEPNLVIPVVSLPVLLVLKLFAWTDRKHEKRDAPDVYTLLRQYGDAGNEDRLYGEEMSVLEAEGYDFELAGARLIASDAARVVSAGTHKRLREILESDALMEELTNEIIVSFTAE